MVQEINAAEFEDLVIKSGDPVIVDFYSSECPPCEALAPRFHFFADLYGDRIRFYKIFRQDNRDLAQQLGVMSSPTLLFYKDGKEVAPRLNGAIRKVQLKEKILQTYGVPDATSDFPRQEITCDVAIIGGGPAGLTAAIYASRAKLKTYVIDKGTPGGYVNVTHSVANYPGTGKDIQGFMLAHFMAEQARQSGAHILMAADIAGLDLNNKTVYVDDDKELRARAVILATGSKPRPLNIPGEAELTGKGISYCATCDGAFYEGRNVYVIGGGNSAVEEALYLTRFAASVTIIHQFDEFQANKAAVEEALDNPKINVMWSHEPRAFIGNSTFEKLEVENLKTGKRTVLEDGDGVFIFVGFVPQTGFITDDVEKDSYGYLKTDDSMATSLPGVFAAGDVRSKKFRQITTAVSDGTIAALEAGRYIKEG